MKKLFTILLIVSVYSCTQGVSQKTSQEMKKEAEFEEVLRKSREASDQNQLVMKKADSASQQVIQKTTEQIVSLKQEVKQLKQELNETDIDPTDGTKFELLPITNNPKDRK
jgi:TolA-binding protein